MNTMRCHVNAVVKPKVGVYASGANVHAYISKNLKVSVCHKGMNFAKF